jgi:hypothetical protein
MLDGMLDTIDELKTQERMEVEEDFKIDEMECSGFEKIQSY